MEKIKPRRPFTDGKLVTGFLRDCAIEEIKERIAELEEKLDQHFDNDLALEQAALEEALEELGFEADEEEGLAYNDPYYFNDPY
jgi:hypothetical protein